MGWASGGDIFDTVARSLIDARASNHVKREVLGPLVDKLQDGDWDTEDESLEKFRADPVIVQVFADHGIGEDEDEGGI